MRKTWDNKNLYTFWGRVNWYNHLKKLFDSMYYSWPSNSILEEKLKRIECTGSPKDKFKETLFIISLNWKYPTYPPTIGWIYCYIHTVEDYRHVFRMSKLELQSTVWMDLTNNWWAKETRHKRALIYDFIYIYSKLVKLISGISSQKVAACRVGIALVLIWLLVTWVCSSRENLSCLLMIPHFSISMLYFNKMYIKCSTITIVIKRRLVKLLQNYQHLRRGKTASARPLNFCCKSLGPGLNPKGPSLS